MEGADRSRTSRAAGPAPRPDARSLLAPAYERLRTVSNAWTSLSDYATAIWGEEFETVQISGWTLTEAVVVLRHHATGAWVVFPLRTQEFESPHATFEDRWEVLHPLSQQIAVETGLGQATAAATLEALFEILGDQGPSSVRAGMEAAVLLDLPCPEVEAVRLLVALGGFGGLRDTVAFAVRGRDKDATVSPPQEG